MAVYKWLQMQQPHFYYGRNFKLMPKELANALMFSEINLQNNYVTME
jgi:hypothetical protein